MAVTRNPGIGQGKGGGRPARGPAVRVRLDLSPEAAAALEGQASAAGLPLWRVVDDLIRVGLKGEAPEPAPKLPALAHEVAREAAAFLEAHAANPQRSARALRRAWSQALILAAHDLEG